MTRATVAQVGRIAAGEQEQQHQKNIARAASKTPTIDHFIMSTLPPAGQVSGGKLKVPHMDYKHAVYEWMQSNLPDLAKKTTRLWLGWYPSNLAYFPMMKFIPVVSISFLIGNQSPTNADSAFSSQHDSGSYLFVQPSKPNALLPVAGDVDHNTGVMVEGILNAGPKAYGKIAIEITEYMTFTDMAKLWEKATGKHASFLEVTDEEYRREWGVAGEELAAQLRWSEAYPYWDKIVPGEVISLDELGVKNKLVGVEPVLKSLKPQLV